MGIFDLKGGESSGWNYSDSDKPNYMESIEGTVVEISNPQARDYMTKEPKFWPDGNPVRNLQLTIMGRSGQELAWTFSPKSVAADACKEALDPKDERDHVSIEEMLGKFVRISTKPGSYNMKHPRPWAVNILGDGDASAVRGLKDLSTQPAKPEPEPQKQDGGYNQWQTEKYEADPTGGLYASDIPF